MKLHFLRNATLTISTKDHTILLDPMLATKGAIPPLSFVRHRARRNPLVSLPGNAQDALAEVDTALITHCKRGHADHLDKNGARFLAGKGLPTYCREADEKFLRKRGINARRLRTGERQDFLGGHITPIPTKHGCGWIAALMGPGVGYFIELPDEPSLYIAGDTVMTNDVRSVLRERKPDVAIVAAGNASVDIGKPILMSLAEVMEFTSLAPGKVIANHLEALNHCPVTRAELAQVSREANLSDKLQIPADGDILKFERKTGD